MGRIENVKMTGIITNTGDPVKFLTKEIPHTSPVTVTGSNTQNFTRVSQLSFSGLAFSTKYAVDFVIQGDDNALSSMYMIFANHVSDHTVRQVGVYKCRNVTGAPIPLTHRFIFTTDAADGNLSLFVASNSGTDITLGINSTPTGASCEVTVEELGDNGVLAVGDMT